MINLMLGSSGSGKSYEATVYHVLEALKKGRKVITNLPLNLDEFSKINPEYLDLIELRTRAQPIRGTWNAGTEQKAFLLKPESEWRTPDITKRVFSGVWDYYDEWRHPVSGTGALIIVDEAQNVIPSTGCEKSVKEWTALHRHWFNDVYYITQSYGKLEKDIRENVQMVYRFRKMVAWGRPDKYIRKVQDGVRGEVLNTTQRTYDAKFFPLYRSHTQADGVGAESSSADIVPIWKHWSFMGAGLLGIIFLIMLFSGVIKNPMSTKAYKQSGAVVSHAYEQAKVVSNVKHTPTNSKSELSSDAPKAFASVELEEHEPLEDRGVHIMAHLKSATKETWLFAVSQNGQGTFNLTLPQLIEAGYTYKGLGDCVGLLSYKSKSRYVICDAPQISVGVAGNNKSHVEPSSSKALTS